MRYRTIQNRLRLAMLPEAAIEWLHQRLRGIPDDKTRPGNLANQVWCDSVREMLKKWPTDQVEPGQSRCYKPAEGRDDLLFPT